MATMDDYSSRNKAMLSAPAAERNKDAILEVLQANMDASRQSRVLEIAAGEF